MARKPRIIAPDTIHHVTARGVDRRTIFHDDADCWAWTQMLGEACVAHSWRCIAYCLMVNHVHLLVQVREVNLSQGLQLLLSEYARRHHHRYRSTGHVFQGRFHSSLVERDPYLLEVVRYILLNPVRANLCGRPENWKWSSARPSFALDPQPAWLDLSLPYTLLGPVDRRSPGRLLRFVLAGAGDNGPQWDAKARLTRPGGQSSV